MVVVKTFSGLIGSGKDTCCDYLVEHHGYTKISIAGSLKTFATKLLQAHYAGLEVTEDMMYNRESKEKEYNFEFVGKPFSLRWYLQYLGTDICRDMFGPDVWVNMVVNQIKSNNLEKVCIADARFSNEIRVLREAFDDVHAFRVNRGTRVTGSHASENNSFEVDVELKNNETIEELYHALNKYLER